MEIARPVAGCFERRISSVAAVGAARSSLWRPANAREYSASLVCAIHCATLRSMVLGLDVGARAFRPGPRATAHASAYSFRSYLSKAAMTRSAFVFAFLPPRWAVYNVHFANMRTIVQCATSLWWAAADSSPPNCLAHRSCSRAGMAFMVWHLVREISSSVGSCAVSSMRRGGGPSASPTTGCRCGGSARRSTFAAHFAEWAAILMLGIMTLQSLHQTRPSCSQNISGGTSPLARCMVEMCLYKGWRGFEFLYMGHVVGHNGHFITAGGCAPTMGATEMTPWWDSAKLSLHGGVALSDGVAAIPATLLPWRFAGGGFFSVLPASTGGARPRSFGGEGRRPRSLGVDDEDCVDVEDEDSGELLSAGRCFGGGRLLVGAAVRPFTVALAGSCGARPGRGGGARRLEPRAGARSCPARGIALAATAVNVNGPVGGPPEPTSGRVIQAPSDPVGCRPRSFGVHGAGCAGGAAKEADGLHWAGVCAQVIVVSPLGVPPELTNGWVVKSESFLRSRSLVASTLWAMSMSLSLNLRNGTGHVRRQEAVEGSAHGIGRNEFEAWMSLARGAPGGATIISTPSAPRGPTHGRPRPRSLPIKTLPSWSYVNCGAGLRTLFLTWQRGSTASHACGTQCGPAANAMA